MIDFFSLAKKWSVFQRATKKKHLTTGAFQQLLLSNFQYFNADAFEGRAEILNLSQSAGRSLTLVSFVRLDI